MYRPTSFRRPFVRSPMRTAPHHTCTCTCPHTHTCTTDRGIVSTERYASKSKLLAVPNDVFVLDFDGVLADSQFEVSSAGLEAAGARWPHLDLDSPKRRERVVKGLARTRPRLVKGYETMVMARLICEDEDNIDRILHDGWENFILPQKMEIWQETEDSLIQFFEELRNRRASQDPDAWVSLTQLYPGVAEALTDCSVPWYICSSKRGDRLATLLQALLGLNVDQSSSRLFHTLIPPTERKIKALCEIQQRPLCQDPQTTLHFVDDRFETIQAAALEEIVRSRYKLYLADWGYNTAEERKAASQLPGVKLPSLKQFCELLRFQLVMGVNDGCQDTETEALAAVYRPFKPK